MKSLLITTMLATLLAATSGCRTFTSPARARVIEANEGKVLWMDFDATRRGGILVGNDNNVQLVLEPAPDAAVASVAEFVTKVNIKDKFTADQATTISESLSSLGKRTTSVMVLREALFRLNQLTASGGSVAPESAKLFELIIKEASTIAQIEAAAEKAKSDQAHAETKRIELQKLEFETKVQAINASGKAPEDKAQKILSLDPFMK